MNSSAHKWCFYLEPQKTWEAMFNDCQSAKQTIEMEQYIFRNDAPAQKFMRLFIEKAKEGVHVRLLCDDIGSSSFHGSSLVNELREAGGIFHFYNSLKWIDLLKPRRLFPRTHLKVLVIDEHISYIGGTCVAEEMAHWRDTQIRLVGPVGHQIKKALDRNSQEVLGLKASRLANIVEPESTAHHSFRYIQNDPAFFRHPIYKLILQYIRQAKDHIYISAAFFIPTLRLRVALRAAARRGVNVIILVPQKSDSIIADLVCLSYAMRLIKSGVNIYQYMPHVLHTKTIVVDGKWGMAGSCNFDPLSFFHNREANIIITEHAALEEMKRDFLNDISKARQVSKDFLKKLPLWKKIMGRVYRLLRPIL